MYQVAAYGYNRITSIAHGASMEEARSVAREYVAKEDVGHVAIIGDSGITAEYWKCIDGKPRSFDARANHMAYRDMMSA
jgi:hypothetical protein